MRSAGAIESQARLAVLALEDASRSACAIVGLHGTPDGKREFLLANNELQDKILEVQERAKHGIERDAAVSLADEQVFAEQLRLDQILGQLQVDTAFANKRAEQLLQANRSIGEDIKAAERAEGIFVHRTHEGKLA
ncbi:hypothetical protein QPK32_07355 [Massilia sp. YIM B02763]|uniref:hypothetical protein n=1 Tax=Massilia sp. YIM B02763 TaxID=3050130 RepID=UPI0025B686F8|nr:hypothetical protein [Massilia sp. YIM B02763]MDN4052889.1 hypothetical protein [Massilia sp. YIM B02763]